MKNIIIFISILMQVPLFSQINWENVIPGQLPNSSKLFGPIIKCADSENCVVVTQIGSCMYVYTSNDAGKNWKMVYYESFTIVGGQIVAGPDPQDYFNVSYPSKDTIFIGREKGIIFRSYDGGVTYDTISFAWSDGTNNHREILRIMSLNMKNSREGITGTARNIFVTQDGWTTFTRLTPLLTALIPEGYDLYFGNDFQNTFHYFDKDNFLIFGTIFRQTEPTKFEYLFTGFFRTTDAGANWSLHNLIQANEAIRFTCRTLNFYDDNIGFAMLSEGHPNGDGSFYYYSNVIKTTDGGHSWELKLREDKRPGTLLYNMAFWDADKVIIAGTNAKIYYSFDGGDSWQFELASNSKQESTRVMQHVDIAGDYAILSTTYDGVWRGKNPLSFVSESIPLDIISIRPNPATDYIYINLVDVSVFGGVKIYNMLGECVSHFTPTLSEGEGVRIDVSHLSPGVYFVRYGSHAEKFVKW